MNQDNENLEEVSDFDQKKRKQGQMLIVLLAAVILVVFGIFFFSSTFSKKNKSENANDLDSMVPIEAKNKQPQSDTKYDKNSGSAPYYSDFRF